MKIRFTPIARHQFLKALDYIRADKQSAAMTFRKKAERALSRLEDFPESGRILPEFPDLPFREVIVVPYRFFYRIKMDTVWVIAVWHDSQLPDEPGENT